MVFFFYLCCHSLGGGVCQNPVCFPVLEGESVRSLCVLLLWELQCGKLPVIITQGICMYQQGSWEPARPLMLLCVSVLHWDSSANHPAQRGLSPVEADWVFADLI